MQESYQNLLVYWEKNRDAPIPREEIVPARDAVAAAAGVIAGRQTIRAFDSQPPDHEFMLALGCVKDGDNYTHGRMKVFGPLETPVFHYAGALVREFPIRRSEIRKVFALLGLLTPEQRSYLDENLPQLVRAS